MQLVERAGDLMAKVNGKEQFVTIGASHFTQFNKHAMNAGKTQMKALQDNAGRIVAKVQCNGNFKDMLERGWG